MKYRIIEEVDGNDDKTFFVELERKGLFGLKWVKVKDYRSEFYREKSFATYESAMRHVNLYKITSTIVAEGEV